MRAWCRTGGRGPRRRGMTLVEVLVAMSVLLVGIWGVARGFPALLRVARDEARRTEMSRLAQSLSQQLASDPAGLPALIYGDGGISPLSRPGDPDSYSPADNPPNARDDLIHVLGERGIIPAVAPGSTQALYAFKLGRANALAATATPPLTPVVREVVNLTSLAVTQHYAGPSGELPNGTFRLEGDGTVTVGDFADAAHEQLNWAPSALEISYAWRDTDGKVHWVQRERVVLSAAPAPAGTVAAAALTGTPAFDSIVEGSAWGAALNDFTFAGVGPGAVNPGQYGLDNTGAVLRFHPADSGRRILVDYDLQTEDATYHRRAREIWEDVLVSRSNATDDTADPTYAYVTVQLSAPNIEGVTPLNLPLVPTAASPVPTHVLALDLRSGGAPYYETAGIDPATGIDYKRGRVTLHVPQTALGHVFRFYYRTADQAMLTVLKPAERFLPADTFPGATPPAPTFATDVIGTSPNLYTVLNFLSGADTTGNPISTSAGMMVSVDYTYGNPAAPTRVTGELHAIPTSSSQINGNDGYFITLNHPGVQEIVAVRAASLRVRAWWRTESGRLQTADIDTLIPPLPAPS